MSGRVLPTDYSADRFYVLPVTENGTELRLYTDTGGGVLLFAEAADRAGVHWEPIEPEATDEGVEIVGITSLPRFVGDTWIPDILQEWDPRPESLRGKLFVVRGIDLIDGDGLLGQVWFAGRCWTFDYLRRRLVLHDSPPEMDGEHLVALGFPRDETGMPRTHFPSIEATIDGQTSAFLFDTGAMISLTDGALAAFSDGGGRDRGTCFVVGSIFDGWRADHPDWPLVERADRNIGEEPIIQVPTVTIAEHPVGPVWFTRRPDESFHSYMSSMMDRRVDGALGGSLLRYFSIDVDYPSARAYFSR